MSESDSDENEMSEDNDRNEPTVKPDDEVQVFHRVNKLKKKAGGDSNAGPGYIDKSAINRAQTVIEDKMSVYTQEVAEVIKSIEASWKEAIDSNLRGDKADLEDMYHYSNHIKDLAATFGYNLMKHFGTSLRDFVEDIDLDNKAHHTIVKAHIDVMWVVYNENIKDHGDDMAKELKHIVAKAIEKYS